MKRPRPQLDPELPATAAAGELEPGQLARLSRVTATFYKRIEEVRPGPHGLKVVFSRIFPLGGAPDAAVKKSVVDPEQDFLTAASALRRRIQENLHLDPFASRGASLPVFFSEERFFTLEKRTGGIHPPLNDSHF